MPGGCSTESTDNSTDHLSGRQNPATFPNRQGRPDAWLVSYNRYLRDVVGAATATGVRHSRVIRRFMDACFERRWTDLSIERVTEFIRGDTASKKGYGRRAPACAIRSSLRFLAWGGAVPPGLDRAVPKIRLLQHASLPPHLSPGQLAQLLKGAKTAGVAARRDRAILLLLAHLGLRAAEIVALEVDDIDWRTGLLSVAAGKSRRERVLPLPQEVGEPLADYLQHDRPSDSSRSMESFCVHARTLKQFVTNDKGNGNNCVVARDLASFLEHVPSDLTGAFQRLNSQMAHLAKTRTTDANSKFTISDAKAVHAWLEGALAKFVESLDLEDREQWASAFREAPKRLKLSQAWSVTNLPTQKTTSIFVEMKVEAGGRSPT